jgi:prepilin-type N-terminal cleavage/methylation domain-containing protein
MKQLIKRKGFTLIELLVVIGIIAILAAIAIIAINPARQFALARNAQRWNDVNAILNAISQQAVDNNGKLYSGITTTPQVIGTDTTGCDVCTAKTGTSVACLNLGTGILVDKYITAVPTDPNGGTDGKTNYYVLLTSTKRVEVGACEPEESATINVTR